MEDKSQASMSQTPLKILLAGYFGFDNAGDEALFESEVENFQRLDPECEIRALINDASNADRLGVEAIPRKDVARVWKAMRQSDVFVLGGGGLFQDATGPGSVFYYGGLLALAKMAGCPSVIFCQGYGPVSGGLQKFFTKQVVKLPRLVTVRDTESKKEFEALGLAPEQVHLTADPALLLSALPLNEMRQILVEEDLLMQLGRSELPNGQLSVLGPLVAVSVREWPTLDIEELGKALVAFREETRARYLFVPFQPERDLEPSKKLKELLGGEARVLDRELEPRAIIGVLSCCDMVIGMRLHSLILANMGNPPMFGLAYDPKVERFCRRAGALSCSIEEISSKRLSRDWLHLLNGRNIQRECQQKALDAMREKVEAAFLATLAVGRREPAESIARYF